MNIGEKICQLRKDRGMTQEMLAEQLVISAQAISKWERGVANPDIEQIPRIAKLFGISTDELLGLSAPKSTESELEKRVASLERLLEMLTAKDEGASREIMLREAPRVVSFDFAKMSAADKKKWKPDGLHVLDDKGALCMKAVPVQRAMGAVIDPQFIIAGLSIPLNGVSRILIKLSTQGNRNHHDLQVFFITKDNPEWDEQKSIRTGYPNGNKLTLDLAVNNPLFCGVLTGLRIDPFSQGDGRAEIESVMLLTPQGEVVFEMDAEMCKQYVIHLGNDEKFDNLKSPGPILKNATLCPELPCITFLSDPVKIMREVWDPMLSCDDLDLNIDRARYIHLRIKTTLFDQNRRVYYNNSIPNNAEMKLYFKTPGCEDYTEQRKFNVHYLATGQMQDIYVDTMGNGFWHGKLTGLRLDPIENQGAAFELAQIELLEGTPKVRLSGFMSSLDQRMKRLEQEMDDLRSEVDDLSCVRDDCEDLCDELDSRVDELENRLDALENDD
ncbi:MAG: helix-turn-helix domain-containing protein [Clostridia bacterium]|nr:helix-turn-helix domain-containing protein [Clostridia bacterium]